MLQKIQTILTIIGVGVWSNLYINYKVFNDNKKKEREMAHRNRFLMGPNKSPPTRPG